MVLQARRMHQHGQAPRHICESQATLLSCDEAKEAAWVILAVPHQGKKANGDGSYWHAGDA